MKTLFAKIEESTDQTGLKFDAKGKQLDASMVLDLLDAVEVGFDKDGKPTSCFIVHPSMMPTLKKAADEVENDPELKRRLKSIDAKQRQQWLDRENRRKLVD